MRFGIGILMHDFRRGSSNYNIWKNGLKSFYFKASPQVSLINWKMRWPICKFRTTSFSQRKLRKNFTLFSFFLAGIFRRSGRCRSQRRKGSENWVKMSTVYVLEPPTRGKVVLNTTCGPLDIELWPKEAPKAVRNFVQLCLEGYYDNTIFHRIIKDFIVQGGDPTGSGTGPSISVLLPSDYIYWLGFCRALYSTRSGFC